MKISSVNLHDLESSWVATFSLFILLLFCHQTAMAQVGINSFGLPAHSSAGLDVSYQDKGLLIPRVMLLGINDIITVPSPATSLLVYNLNTAGTGDNAVTPGYYYWTGASWMRFSTAGTAWSLTGNSGTGPSGSFIGTTDNAPFRIRINNVGSGIISSSYGYGETGYGYGALRGWGGPDNAAFGYQSLSGDTIGSGNTAVGAESQRYNMGGCCNTSVGMHSLETNAWSFANIAIGEYAMQWHWNGDRNTVVGSHGGEYFEGTNNVAVGWQALSWMSGSNNTIVGTNAAQFTSTGGSNNIIVGYGSDISESGDNNIVVGYNITGESGSFHMNLGNLIFGDNIDGSASTISSGNIGIGTKDPLNRLHIVPVSGDPLRIEGLQVTTKDTVLVVSGNGVVSKRLGNFGGSSVWSVTGNAGTDPSLNFLGTTDSKDVVIKTNSTERMRFLSTGEVRIGSTLDYSKFEADGTLEFKGAAMVWNEVTMPGLTGKTAAVSPAFLKFVDNGFSSTGVWQYQYQHKDGIEESLFFTIEMPHDLKETTAIDPHVHWAPMNSGTGNVTWSIEYTWVDNNGTFGPTSVVSGTSSAGGALKSTMTSLGLIYPATDQKHIYSILLVRLFRNNAAGTDTHLGMAAMLSFDVAYEANTAGSRTEFAK